jgi:branched-subunit amino acid aminotransferase/4-amino-4-deoxychorismate lyase
VKAFTFRLEQALRWRETQVSLQKSRVAGAAGRLAEIAATLEAQRADLANAADRIVEEPTGAALASYAGFKQKSRARIGDLEAQALISQRTVTLEMNRLIEATQRARLLEHLKQAGQDQWRRRFDRELSASADEAFLCRIQAKFK